jgi:Fe2+ transport system protein FeoA
VIAADLFRALLSSRGRAAPDCPDGLLVPGIGHCEDCGATALTALRPGAEATVSCLEADGSAMAKLAALGILPGARLRLLRRYPVYVFRIGYSEVAVDDTLAELVRVRVAGPGPSI